MKYLSTLFIVLFAFYIVNGQRCDDLMISEIVFGNEASFSGDTTFGNYSVELFNPTDSMINLSNYKVALISTDSITTTMNLSGTIDSAGTYVISNTGASVGISAVSDTLTKFLDFENKVVLQLLKNNIPIDIFGKQGFEKEYEVINLDSLLNDPSYIDDIEISFESIRSLLLRRKETVQTGNTNFQNEDVLDEWIFFPNFEISNLGEHLNACFVAVLSWKDNNPLLPEITTIESSEEDLEYTIEIGGVLEDFVIIRISSANHLFNSPQAEDATLLVDYDYDFLNETTIPAFSTEFDLDICSIIDDNDIEGNEGFGFWLFMEDDNGTGSFISGDPILDILIEDNEVSTNEPFLDQNKIFIYPTVAINNINFTSQDKSVKIEEIIVLSFDGSEIKRAQFPSVSELTLDISPLTVNGYYSVLIKTNKGALSKKIIKLNN